MTYNFYPEDYGITGPLVDSSDAINAAIQAAGDAGGGIVWCLEPVYGLEATVVVDRHNVYLKGRGTSWFSNKNAWNDLTFEQFGGTVFRPLSAYASGIIFRPKVDPVLGTRLTNVGMEGIVFDAKVLVNFGVQVLSVVNGHFPEIIVNMATSLGVSIGVVAAGDLPVYGVGGATYTEPRDTQWCNFGLIVQRMGSVGTEACLGVLISGDSIADVSFCKFDRIFYFHKNNAGLKIGSSDGNYFGFITGGRWAGGTWGGTMFLRGAGTADVARHIHIEIIQPGAGGLATVGSGALFPSAISVDRYSTGNGSPAPGTITGVTIQTVL